MRKQFPFWVALLLWIVVSCMSPLAFATGMTPVQQVRAVQALEDALFSAHEEQTPLETRVSRLEQTVFGESDPDTGETLEPQGTPPEKAQPAGRRAQKVSSSNVSPGSPRASLEARIVRLQKAIAANRPVGASAAAKPAAMPNAASENASAGDNAGGQLPNLRSLESRPEALPGNSASAAAPSADETDYPTVTRMEQKVFGQTYQKEDITARLSRLEKQVFHVVQGGALADRVDNLRLVVLGDAGPGDPNIMPLPPDAIPTAPYQATGPPAAAVGYPAYGFPGGPAAVPYGGTYTMPGMPGMPSTSGYRAPSFYQPPSTYPSYPNYPNSAAGGVASPSIPAPSMGSMGNAASSGDMLVAMNEVEKQVLGRTYAGEPVNTRLDRLETKFFHSTSPELPSEDRMQRVIAVASAGGAPESAKAKARHGLQILLPIILTILPLVLL